MSNDRGKVKLFASEYCKDFIEVQQHWVDGEVRIAFLLRDTDDSVVVHPRVALQIANAIVEFIEDGM